MSGNFLSKILSSSKRPDQASVKCEINLRQNYFLLLVTTTTGQQLGQRIMSRNCLFKSFRICLFVQFLMNYFLDPQNDLNKLSIVSTIKQKRDLGLNK